MNNKVEQMLSNYDLSNRQNADLALREVLQEVVLCGLARSDFFTKAAFTGGTDLRILHGLDRFSEDLDFSLKVPNPDFDFSEFLGYVANEAEANGFDVCVQDKPRLSSVQSAFLKADTFQLFTDFTQLDPARLGIRENSKTKIKIEVDTNPPNGANYETVSRDLPDKYFVDTLDLSSMFALKIHAILCRGFLKGRDYYDFVWLSEKGVPVNTELLCSALLQTEGSIPDDILGTLKDKFSKVPMNELKTDLESFVYHLDKISGWNNEMFLQLADSLSFTGFGRFAG